MKKLLMVFLLVGIVVFSGCTNQGGIKGSGSGDGVKISSFIVDPPEVEGGETVYLLMDIQNVGGAIAQNIRAELIGLPSGWGGVGNPAGNPGTLYPPEKGIQGEIATIQWTLTSPPSRTDIDYPVEGQITYDYSTKSETLVRLVSRDWLMKLPYDQREAERKKQGVVSGGLQLGPIHATVKPASTSGDSLILDIQNVGNGYPKDNRITIQFDGITCNNLNSGSTIELIRGKNRQYRCNPTQTSTEQWQNVRVDVTLTYTYITKASTNIRVLGTPTG